MLLSDIACPWPKEYNETDNLMTRGYNMSGDCPWIWIGEELEYVCSQGRKFLDDLTVLSQNTTCQDNNTWVPSTNFWSKCVDSKQRNN